MKRDIETTTKVLEILKKILVENNISIAQFARKLKVPYNTCNHWFYNPSIPSLKYIKRISQTFGINISRFFKKMCNELQEDNENLKNRISILEKKIKNLTKENEKLNITVNFIDKRTDSIDYLLNESLKRFLKNEKILQHFLKFYKKEQIIYPETIDDLKQYYRLNEYTSKTDIIKEIFKEMFKIKRYITTELYYSFNNIYNVLSCYNKELDNDEEFLKSIED